MLWLGLILVGMRLFEPIAGAQTDPTHWRAISATGAHDIYLSREKPALMKDERFPDTRALKTVYVVYERSGNEVEKLASAHEKTAIFYCEISRVALLYDYSQSSVTVGGLSRDGIGLPFDTKVIEPLSPEAVVARAVCGTEAAPRGGH